MTATPTRCAYRPCGHGPGTHVGGGRCTANDCECRRYVDVADVQAAMRRHPSGRGWLS